MTRVMTRPFAVRGEPLAMKPEPGPGPVTVDKAAHIRARRREPRGFGHWRFRVAGSVVVIPASYPTAEARAVALARERGVGRVELLP